MKKIILVMFTGMLLLVACLFYSTVPAYASSPRASGIQKVVLNDSTGTGGGTADTGVSDLDNSVNRGIGILEGLTKSFGIAVGIIGIVLAIIGWAGHQDDLKYKAPIFIFSGVVVFFAKEIIYFLVGKG